jgi:hypothetical protein
VANEVVGIDITARLEGFRAELAKIPEIGGKEAKALVGQLSREIKAAERASQAAAKAAADHKTAIQGLAGQIAKAQLGMEAFKKVVDVGAKAIGALVARAGEIDGEAKTALDEFHKSAEGLTNTLAIALVPAIVSVTSTLTDLADGAKLAMDWLTGLDRVQAQAAARTEAGRAAIERQAERVVAIKGEIAAAKELARINGWSEASYAALTKTLERESEVLRRLKGELADVTRMGPAPSRGAAPSASPSRASPVAAAVEAVAPSASDWEPVQAEVREANEAMLEFRRLVEEAASISDDETTRIQKNAEKQKAALRDALMAYAIGTETTEAERLRAIQSAREAEVAIEEAAADQINAIARAQHAEQMEQIEERKRATRQAWMDGLEAASATLGAVGNLAQETANIVIAAKGRESAEAKKAAEIGWGISSAMAIAQAAINIPLAVSNAFTSGSQINPVFGIAMGIAAGIAASASLAAVIAKAAAGPQFHSGGMVGSDEVSARLRRGEAVLTPQAVSDLGGREGVAEANRGGASRENVVVIRLDHRVLDIQTQASLDRRRGPLYEAIRSTQPRVGLHRARV